MKPLNKAIKFDKDELRKMVDSMPEQLDERKLRAFVSATIEALFESLGPDVPLSTRKIGRILANYGLDFGKDGRDVRQYWRVYQACRALERRGKLIWNQHTSPVTFELKSEERKVVEKLEKEKGGELLWKE